MTGNVQEQSARINILCTLLLSSSWSSLALEGCYCTSSAAKKEFEMDSQSFGSRSGFGGKSSRLLPWPTKMTMISSNDDTTGQIYKVYLGLR
jgi:hypothetical protein